MSSQALETEWVSAQSTAQSDNLVSVDCAVDPMVCRRMDVMRYPAIRLYHKDGNFDRYRGLRNAVSILAFFRRALRPKVSGIEKEELHNFMRSDDISIAAELLPQEAGLYEDRYRSLARQYSDRFSFAILPPAQHRSSVRCRNNIDEEDYVLTELSSVDAMDELLSKCTHPLILEPTRKDMAELGQRASEAGKTIMVHYFALSDGDKEKYRHSMRPLAKKYSAELQFTIIDSNQHPAMPAAAGLQEGTKVGLSIENMRTGGIFPYTGKAEISATVLEEFLSDIIGGFVKPWDGSRIERPARDEL
ncbi:hypothetical protein GQ53DRAFT_778127 [Thozetella sp. PMI_491]|nr:hypothetical protein GQ53DRAFT_778127 [Thozetella sp. PMI_491]